MAYPSRGDLKNIPTAEQDISSLNKKTQTEWQNLYDNPADSLWVLKDEPTVDFYFNASPQDKNNENLRALNQLKIFHQHIEPGVSLFTKRPEIKDIQQAAIGDCWFLAAITSVLALPGGPEYLQSMIYDDQKDWITVRLYDRTKNPATKNLEFRPRYIKMKRTIVETSTRQTIHSRSKDGLWVCALEKAMTAFNNKNLLQFNQTIPDYYQSFQPHNATYLNLAGGYSYRALELFFGVSFTIEGIPDEIDKNQEFNYLLDLLKARGIAKSGNPMQKIANPPAPSREIVNRPILDNVSFEKFYKEADEKSESLYTDFEEAHTFHYLKKGGQEIKVKGALRLEDFVQFILYELGIRDALVKEKILKWVSERAMFPGKRGTAKYSAKQEEFYNTLGQYLVNGPVCIGTHTYVARSSSGTGQSGGEQMSKGLAGGHAYAVLEVLRANGEVYFLVANPWGQYGRIYKEIREKDTRVKTVTADKEGYFWMDLFDVTKRASTMYYAPVGSATEINNKIKSVAGGSKKNGIDNYPSVDNLQFPVEVNPNSTCPEYAYHVGNSYLSGKNLLLLKSNMEKIGKTSKREFISRIYGKNEFDRAISLKDMKEYMGNVLRFVADLNKNIHQGKMAKVQENKKDPNKPINDRNFFLFQNDELLKIQPSLQNALQLKEWKDASYVSVVASRKRIVPVDKAVEEYIKIREQGQKELKNKLFNLFDALGVLFEQTRAYLNNYPDSGRRLGTGALEYLVIMEITRLLELIYLMKIDITTVTVAKNKGLGINYLKSIDEKIFEQASIPRIITGFYREKAELRIVK